LVKGSDFFYLGGTGLPSASPRRLSVFFSFFNVHAFRQNNAFIFAYLPLPRIKIRKSALKKLN
jgi:hypothetical protein